MKVAILLLPVALIACGKPSVTAENASAEEVAAKLEAAGAGALKLTPGRYESTVTIDKVDIPGMTPEMMAQLRRAAPEKATASCLTPEQANRPAAEFFGGKDRKNCRYDKFEMGGGAIDATMTCTVAGGDISVAMKGEYDAKSFKATMTTEANQGMPNAMTMAATVTSRWAGECTGQEGRQ